MPIQNSASQTGHSHPSAGQSLSAEFVEASQSLVSIPQLETQLTEWCRDAHPTENRIEAKNRILQYVISASNRSTSSSQVFDTLDLSNLSLRSVVDQYGTSGLPPCLANLQHLVDNLVRNSTNSSTNISAQNTLGGTLGNAILNPLPSHAHKLRRLDLRNNAYRFVPDVVIQLHRRIQVDLNGNPFEAGALDLAKREIAHRVAQTLRRQSLSQTSSQRESQTTNRAPDPDLFITMLAQQLATVGLASAENLPIQIEDIQDTHYDKMQVMHMAQTHYLKGRIPGDNKAEVIARIQTCFQAQINSPGSAHATQLDLSGLHISQLPDCFHLLKLLRTLDLSGNNFSQKRSLPIGISELQNLEQFKLNHCDIRDVPSILGALPSGCVVDLRSNPLNSTAQMSFNVAKTLTNSLPLEAGPTYLFDSTKIAENCPAPTALQAVSNWKSRAKESLDENNIRDLNALIEVLGIEDTQVLNNYLLQLEQIPNVEYPTEELIDKVNHLIDFLMTKDGRGHNRIVELIENIPISPSGLLIGLCDCLAVANSRVHLSGDELTIQQFIHNSRGLHAYLNLRPLCKSVVQSFNIPNGLEFTINCLRRFNQQHPMDLIATTSTVSNSAPHLQLLKQTVEEVLKPVAGEKIAMKLVRQGNWGHIVQTRLPELFAVYKTNVQERLLGLVAREGAGPVNDEETNRIRRNGLYEITSQYLRETGY